MTCIVIGSDAMEADVPFGFGVDPDWGHLDDLMHESFIFARMKRNKDIPALPGHPASMPDCLFL